MFGNDLDINRDPMKTHKDKKFKTRDFKISRIEEGESHDSISYVISTFKCPHGLYCKEPCVMHGKGKHSMCY